MNSICSICQDYLSISANVSVTICGHVFHSSCVEEWFKRTSNCPQCRTNIKSVRRVFFNFSSDESVVENNLFLQNQVKTLKEQFDKNCELIRRERIRLDYFKKKLLDMKKINQNLKNELNILKSDTMVEKIKYAPITNSSGMCLRSGRVIDASK